MPDTTFRGLHQALVREREAARPLRLDVASVQELPGVDATGQGEVEGLFLLRLTAPAARFIDWDHEGWSAAGPWEERGRYPWVGRVELADPEQGNLIVAKTQGKGSPADRREVWLYEPDYQRLLRDWAEAQAEAQGPLPAFYLELASGRVAGGGAVVDLSAWARRDGALRPAQRGAVKAAGKRLSVVWGPPGTGKTFTLGAVGAALSLAGRKVLALAPTNVAADQMALAVDEARGRMGRPLGRGDLIRPGRVALGELERRPHLMAWTEELRALTEAIRGLREEAARLEAALPVRGGASRERALALLARRRQALKDQEAERGKVLWDLAHRASVIVTTLTAALYHPEVREAFAAGPNALLLDEASMIPRYAVLALSEPVPGHLVIGGDPKQLGPVWRSSGSGDATAEHWVGECAFTAIGASDDRGLRRMEEASALTLLDEQSRMNDALCRPVSKAFYQGRLRTAGRPPRPPVGAGFPGEAMLLVDPFATELPPFAPPRVSSVIEQRHSERSAWIAIGLAARALAAAPGTTVLALTPFRDQASLLHKLARAHLSHEAARIRVGTVHVGQGLEADLVIFDPVRPEHPWLMGRLGEGSAARLFCVAFSRARCQLVVLGRPGLIAQSPMLGELCREAKPWTPRLGSGEEAVRRRGRS